MKYSIKTGIWIFLFTIVLFQSSVNSGTIDMASLTPSNLVHESTSLTVRSVIKFEALNDKGAMLRTYHAELSYTPGLNITLATQPAAAKAAVDARKRLIILEWSAVAPGTALTADISVASQTAGTYRIQPSSLYYVDSARKTYATTCSSAEIIVRQDTTAPPAPTQVRSDAQDGSLQVFWAEVSAPDIAGYNIYRRTPSTGYAKINALRISYGFYQDTTVQHGVAYYYAVTAVDTAGNESPLSLETGHTYYDLKIKSIAASGVIAAATGDINGDGRADIVLALPYTEVVKKTTITGRKVDIYFGGNTTGLPDVTFKEEVSGHGFGTSLAVTDLNKDGYDDIIVGAPKYSPPNQTALTIQQGKIYIYRGGPQISATPAFTRTGNQSQGCNGPVQCWFPEQLGASLAAVGDLDGDGFPDLVVGAPAGGFDNAGRIMILHGGPSLAPGALWENDFHCTTGSQGCGTAVASAGDVNGDGHNDIIVAGVPEERISYKYGKVFILSGHQSFQQPPEQLFEYSTGVEDDRFGSLVSSAGDMNGDGYADVAVKGYRSYEYFNWHGEVQTFFGGPVLHNEPEVFLNMPTDHLWAAGDVNYDGYDDTVIDGPTVIFGNAVGDNVPDIVMTNGAVLAVGDVDGDGLKDLITQQGSNIVVRSIALETSLLHIILTSPRYWETTVHPSIAVRGTVKGVAKRVLVKGQPVTVQADGSFSADIALVLGVNTFEVIAESQEGKISKRKLLVNYATAAPLSVAITSPPNLTEVSEPFIDMSGVVSGPRASITVNGVRAVVSQGTFTAAGIVLSEGANTIMAIAKDDYGQTASQSITVVLTSRGTVQGTVIDAATGSPLPGATVTITDAGSIRTASTDASGRYSMAGVRAGSFTITFEKSGYLRQTNNGSLIAGQTLTIDAVLSVVPPLTLSITSPASGATVHASALEVRGSVSNNARVIVNGYEASVSGGAFIAAIPLQQGVNPVTVTASDAYGQTASHNLSVMLGGLLDPQEIFVEPAVVAFPQIVENTSWIGYLNVRNVGTGSLAVGSVGGQSLPFWIEYNGCAGIAIPPGGTCMLRIKFAPPVAGTFTRTYEVPSNDADHPLYTVTLTGTAAASSEGYVVPDTGQKTCAGEPSRNPLSYAVIGDGTVNDNNTGLAWQRTDDGQFLTWAEAVNYCSGLNIGGQGGWRLPARNELLGIVDYGRSQPAVDPSAFPGTASATYWSLTEKDAGAWSVNFAGGSASVMSKTALSRARCVLGSPRNEVPYWDNGDNTVTDLQNGLMWPQQRLAVLASQDGAANVCTGNPIAGYTDWRVPTIKELATNRFNNCIMGDCRLWSSTVSDPSACAQGYVLDLTAIAPENRMNSHLLTCVRGGRMKAAATTPVISGVTVTTSTSSAVVSWTTDQPSYGAVAYGDTTAYGMTSPDPLPATHHTITLTGLVPSTTYHFRITAWTAAGLSATSPDTLLVTRAEFEAVTLAVVGNVTVMEVTGSYDAKKPDGTLNDLPRQAIAKEFLRQHPDEHDFLVIVSNFDFAMPQPEAKAFYLEVRNDTQGIGRTVFDNTAAFGSNSKLQGIIDMGNLSGLGMSPYDAVAFEQALDTLAHEQLHRWAAGVKFRNSDGAPDASLLGKDGMHWSYLLDTDGSLAYGNDWKDNRDGTYTSVSQPKYYSNLDLYLMGMIDKTRVPPMILIENPAIDPAKLPEIGATISGTARTVTIDDIISAEGERVPSAATAQKTFKTGFIFIARPGTFTGSEPAAIETLRNAWAGRFRSHTGGKGSIADVSPSLTVTITSPADSVNITRPDVVVKGTIINSMGNETGVTVNGIIATVTGNQFIANHVPLTEGVNTITATATDMMGNTATATLTVNALRGNYISVTSNIISGIAPLVATLRVEGSFRIMNTSINATGPALPEITTSAPDEYMVKIMAEGTYVFTIRSTGPDGKTYHDEVTVIAQNRMQMDAMLKANWDRMKLKLAIKDVTGAMSSFLEGSKARYQEAFNYIIDDLPVIASQMQNIEMIYLAGNVAKYRINRMHDINGTPQLLTYYIYFYKANDGVWKIDRF